MNTSINSSLLLLLLTVMTIIIIIYYYYYIYISINYYYILLLYITFIIIIIIIVVINRDIMNQWSNRDAFLNTPIFLHLSTLAPSLKVVFQLSLRVSLTPMN